MSGYLEKNEPIPCPHGVAVEIPLIQKDALTPSVVSLKTVPVSCAIGPSWSARKITAPVINSRAAIRLRVHSHKIPSANAAMIAEREKGINHAEATNPVSFQCFRQNNPTKAINAASAKKFLFMNNAPLGTATRRPSHPHACAAAIGALIATPAANAIRQAR